MTRVVSTDAFTWCNRNNTFLRVLIVRNTGDAESPSAGSLAARVERLIVLSAPSVEVLDEHTASLQRLAAAEHIDLIPADGHHQELITRITATNRTRL